MYGDCVVSEQFGALHHGEELAMCFGLPLVIKVVLLEFSNKDRESEGLYVCVIRADPVPIAGVFDSGKDFVDLSFSRDIFVFKVAFAAFGIIAHDSCIEIPCQQDWYLVGGVLLSGSELVRTRGHGSFRWKGVFGGGCSVGGCSRRRSRFQGEW